MIVESPAGTGARNGNAPVRTGGSAIAVVLLVGAILINVIQFRSIDEDTVDFFDAVHRSETGDIVVQGYDECRWCRDRFGLHLAIQVIAPGARVVVPASSPYAANPWQTGELTFRLYSLGGVDRVDWVGYRQDPQLLRSDAVRPDGPPGSLTGFDPTPFIVASGSGGQMGAPWACAVDQPRPATSAAGDPDTFLARALDAGEHVNPTGQPREFVILQWDLPREGSGYDYQDLVLETSLLPDPIREELAP